MFSQTCASMLAIGAPHFNIYIIFCLLYQNYKFQTDAGKVNYSIIELSPTNKMLLDNSCWLGAILATLKYGVTKLHLRF